MTTVMFQDKEYLIGTINAFTQLHLVKRLAPVMGALKTLSDAYDEDNPDAILEPLGRAVGVLPDDDLDYIVNACLDAVQMRQAGGAWARMRTGGALMFEPDLLTLLFLTFQVVKANLSTFFSGLASLSSGAGTTVQASNI